MQAKGRVVRLVQRMYGAFYSKGNCVLEAVDVRIGLNLKSIETEGSGLLSVMLRSHSMVFDAAASPRDTLLEM